MHFLQNLTHLCQNETKLSKSNCRLGKHPGKFMSSFFSCAVNHDLWWQLVHQVLSWHSGLWHWLLQLWSWHPLCLSSSWPHPTWTFLLSAKPQSFLSSWANHPSFFSFSFASVFLLSPFLLDLSFPLLPFFISCMGWADAVSYIFGEGQPARFTTIPGYIGWNSTQAVDGCHSQPRSVACQQQLVLAKSSLYICTAMVKGESNSCQFHESWVLSFSCGSCHLSNSTPVYINSLLLHQLVTLGSVFFLIWLDGMSIISVLRSMTVPIL